MLRLVICAFLLLGTAGCGPKDTDTTTAKEMDDRNNLRQVYSQFVGTYSGFVYEDGNPVPIPAEIKINIVEVPDGVNDNREVIFRPELQGHFIDKSKIAVTPVARRPLRMRYYRDTAEIAMVNTDKVTGPNPDQGMVNISATIRDGHIHGRVKYILGPTIEGRLQVSRESN